MRKAGFYALGILLTGTLGTVAPAATPDVPDLIQQFRNALARNDLSEAANTATKLDDVIQERYRTFLTRDSGERVAEALNWLPPNVESMVVQQEPITLEGDDSLTAFIGKPELLYTMGRLMAVNNGELYKRLSGQVIRLVVVGILNMHGGGTGIPGPMPDADAAYIYFLAQPIEATIFGPPVATVEDHEVWRSITTRNAGLPQLPGIRQSTTQEGETWFALIRSDVLVLATKREFLNTVLGRLARPGPGRALPDALPEWAIVDRNASFWGIRHYSNPASSGDETNPFSKTDQHPPNDQQAVGLTVEFYAERDSVEIRYLSEGGAFPLGAFRHVADQFKVDGSRKGISRLKSNIRERGAFPLHVALHLLGFGFNP